MTHSDDIFKPVMDTIKDFKSEIKWWVAIIVIVVSAVTYIVSNIVSLDRRVSATEGDLTDIKTLFSKHVEMQTQNQKEENQRLTQIETYTKLVSDYFGLKPRQ